MTNPLHRLQELGQSVWYDNVRRALIDSGQLAEYLDEYAVSGITSNPTIFERAISGSDDYDEPLRRALEAGIEDPEELFWDLAIRDIRDAADLLRPIYEERDGADGFISLELPPRLSRDTAGSIELGEELFARVDRPNAMIKVPGTSQGVPAIEELVYRGVNVNVTLLFSQTQWEAVADAHATGLERRLDAGEDLDVASVASFFISRIDAKANERLPEELHNRLGIANAGRAYAAYRRLLDGDRWRRLADAGAEPQRLLWASTSTKDPQLPETYYVTALAAPDTVNTMPESTMFAFAKDGEVGDPLPEDGDDAEEVVAAVAAAGVDVGELGEELQQEGDDKFADSFERLLGCIRTKKQELEAGPRPGRRELAPVTESVQEAVTDLTDQNALRRLWRRDHTLWGDDPTEIADRLGWLTVPEEMEEQVEALRRFADDVAADGLTHALVLGMGGSSLFPLVVAEALREPDGLELHVLDSVDPAAIARVEEELPLERTLVVAASKSGTTAETRALLAWLWDRYGDPARFAVITDPDTPLAELGRDRGFRRVFEARADLGGRYSALSHFGLVPAALAGADVTELLHRAGRMAAACAACVAPEANPGLQLGAVLAGSAGAGRDKLTLVLGERVAAFGSWVEQLIAESTGKRGRGILPVVGEPLGPPEVYGADRLFVAIGAARDALDALVEAGHPVVTLDLDEPVDLGAEIYRWEVATALAGAALDINPFDQPDVEAAKDAARRALDGDVAEVEVEPLDPLLDHLQPGDYLAIQAYVDPADPVVEELQRARAALRDRHRVATTFGVGPRYLHSTGQLHKGGPDTGVFVQVVGEDDHDPQIPGEKFTFGALKRAQAAGDLRTLRHRGRRAGRVTIDELREVSR